MEDAYQYLLDLLIKLLHLVNLILTQIKLWGQFLIRQGVVYWRIFWLGPVSSAETLPLSDKWLKPRSSLARNLPWNCKLLFLYFGL